MSTDRLGLLVKGILGRIGLCGRVRRNFKNRVRCQLGLLQIAAGKLFVKLELLGVGNLREVRLHYEHVDVLDWARPAVTPGKAFAKNVFTCARVAGPPVLKLFRMFFFQKLLKGRGFVPVGSPPARAPLGVSVSRARVFANERPVGSDPNWQESRKREQTEHCAEEKKSDWLHQFLRCNDAIRLPFIEGEPLRPSLVAINEPGMVETH